MLNSRFAFLEKAPFLRLAETWEISGSMEERTYLMFNEGARRMDVWLTVLVAILIVGGLTLCGMARADELRPPRIPLEDFFRLPEKAGFQISFGGKHYAFLQPWNDRLNIYVQALESSEEPLRITSVEERDIRSYTWANDERLLYMQDTGGDENYHIFGVNRDGSDFKELTPFEGVRTGILDILKDDPEHVLMVMNQRDRRFFDVYRMNVYTGELVLVEENPGTIAGWGTDHDGKVRIAYAKEGLERSVLYRDEESQPFETIITTNFTDKVLPVGFTPDNRDLYVFSNQGRDTLALYTFDPKKRELGEMLYEHAEVDLESILWSDARKELLGVSYYSDKRHRHFFDPETEQFFEKLQKRFPGYSVGISDTSLDERRMIIAAGSDRMPGRLYYHDLDKPEEFTLLADLYPWIKEEHMAERRPVTYTSRDGLTIHGYLTLPRGVEPKNLPVVVNPHGGPEARETWGYDPESQFLANRGVAVFQMNFRISTGYGKSFWMAGFKEWGKKQQDDITDGTRWLVQEGIADPERIAIYGGSYGGYATLMGLIREPDLYACGVDYVGVANLFTLLESIPPYWELERQKMYITIGNPETEAELFREISPVFHAEKIVAPLFIAQGANDPRVNKAESDQMVEALRQQGVEVPYMVKDNEGHGFANQENRFDFYRAMETFLGECLSLDIPSPEEEGR
jgi:dipeptidyl aminopeptidase/acylaminoacyl peptidase